MLIGAEMVLRDDLEPERSTEGRWREEINWGYFRYFLAFHGVFWAWGVLVATLQATGGLTGSGRSLLGSITFLLWIASLIGIPPVIKRVGIEPERARLISIETMLVLGGCLFSSLAFALLMVGVGFDKLTLKLF